MDDIRVEVDIFYAFKRKYDVLGLSIQMHPNEEKMLGKVWWVGRVDIEAIIFFQMLKDQRFQGAAVRSTLQNEENQWACKAPHLQNQRSEIWGSLHLLKGDAFPKWSHY